MQFVFYVIFVGAVVLADQFTKALVVANIPLGGHVAFLPGFLDFTYVRNTGAAFSSFEGMQWLFALIFLVFTLGIFYEYFRKRMPFSNFERWMIAAIYAGGLGNMIDRLRLGYVVDMLETLFMDFPVFNVADCFITCRCIGLMVHLAFFNKGFWKDGKK